MKRRFLILFAVLVLAHSSLLVAVEPPPLGTNELAAARSQGSNSLVTFQGFITGANFELMGFSSVAEASAATTTNADPLLIYSVPLNRLANYQPPSDYSFLLYPEPQTIPAPVSRVIIPVMSGTNVRSSISLRLVAAPAGQPPMWTNANWGYPKLIRDLVETSQTIPPAQLASGRPPFVVEVPVFDIWFIGYFDANAPGNLVLLSTADLRFGSIVVHRHEAVTPVAMKQMRIAAQRYNGLAN